MRAHHSATSGPGGCDAATAIMRAAPYPLLSPLVATTALSKRLSLAEPFDDVHTVCCERQLTGDAQQVDVGFAMIAGPERLDTARNLRKRFGNDVMWMRLSDFLETWSQLKHEWTCHVPFVCVAFDCAALDPLPAPCLSLCVEPDFFARRLGFPTRPALQRAQLLQVLCGSHLELCGAAPPEAACERLGRVWDLAAHSGARIKHISIMMSRPGAPVKVDLAVPLAQLAGVLEALDWPGLSEARLLDRVHSLLPETEAVQLNLVLHPAPRYPLEVEVFADEDEPSAERSALLARMVAAQLCTPAEAETLLQIQAAPVIETQHGRALSMNWYIKLRFWESERCDAKAYLGLMPRTRLWGTHATLR